MGAFFHDIFNNVNLLSPCMQEYVVLVSMNTYSWWVKVRS